MESNMAVGIIVVLLSLTATMPLSLAQVDNSCWTKVVPCLQVAKAQGYPPAAVRLCCAGISDAINNNLPCFCSGQADLISQGNGAIAIFNGILGTCNIKGTMASLCSAPCLRKIAPCLAAAKAQNYAPAAVQPCCAGITAAVNNDRSCFCLFQVVLNSQGPAAQAIFNGILGTCGISGTLSSLC